MWTERILPPGIVDVSSRAYAGLVDRFDELDPSVTLVDLIDLVDVSALPTLLAQFHVDFVRPGSSEVALRGKIKGSVAWHRRKGTPEAVAGLVEEMLDIRPAVRERRYFVLGVSGLGDQINRPPFPGFQVGRSRLGVDGLGIPDRWFVADILLESGAAGALGVRAADVDPLVRSAAPARTWAVTRFGPLLAGDPEYGRLGIDVFSGRCSANPGDGDATASGWVPSFFTPILLGEPLYGRLGIALF